jgi:hypothetical protein
LTLSDDPDFDAKVQDVCATYREAPARAKKGIHTVSTDELTGVQALERVHPGLPMAQGKVERREFEYIRHGTCACILSRDVVSGQIIAPYHRIVFHSTPRHCSWLNQIEIFLGILVRKLLKRGSFTSVADFKAKVLDFLDYYNRTMAKPFTWTYEGKPLVS